MTINTDEQHRHPPSTNFVVGVDATRNRSGGAVAHIKGIMSGADPRDEGISTVHVWAHDALLEDVQDQPWLIKHPVVATRKSIFRQIFWQRFTLPREARCLGVKAMFNSDAGSFCPFQPSLSLSQTMLPFEPGEKYRYPLTSKARLRIEMLRFVQLHRLKRSTVALFLTEHAKRVIEALAPLKSAKTIPHGVDSRFLLAADKRRAFYSGGPIHCLYVSNAAPYKHQWHVVEAIAQLRRAAGYDLRLRLVGGGSGQSMSRLLEAVKTFDPEGRFVELVDFVPNDQIIAELAAADIFVYASSCENLPITLLEAMATSIPIVSSDRGPMPEVLGPDGFYFDPEDSESIARAVKLLVEDDWSRQRSSTMARERSQTYTWQRCSLETWRILAQLARSNLAINAGSREQ